MPGRTTWASYPMLGSEQMLGIHLNDGLRPEVEVPQCPQDRAGAVPAELGFEQVKGDAVQPDGRRRQSGGRRRSKASQGMQGHVLYGGQGQDGMPVKAEGPVPDEAAAVAVVAGQVQPWWWISEPQAVISCSAGASQPAVVLNRGSKAFVAALHGVHPAPWLDDSTLRQAPDVPSGVPRIK